MNPLRFLLQLAAVASLLLMPVRLFALQDWHDEWEVPEGFSLKIDVEGFRWPTAIAFVPSPGSDPKAPLYFVTELRGKLKVVTNDRTIYTFAQDFFEMVPPEELPSPEGEIGMAGIALDPVHGYVFVSFVYQDKDKVLRNNIVRFDSEPCTFGLKARGSTSFADIFANYAADSAHVVGPIVIDGDKMFVGVGDGGQPFYSQNPDYPVGKVLRMTLDGNPLPDNPFYVDGERTKGRNYVWAMGFRNPFSLVGIGKPDFGADNGPLIDRSLGEIHRGQNFGFRRDRLEHRHECTDGIRTVGWTSADGVDAGGKQDFSGGIPLQVLSGGCWRQESDLRNSPSGLRLRDRTDGQPSEAIPSLLSIRQSGAIHRWRHGWSRRPLVVPLWPVRPDKDAKGAVLRVAYDPTNPHPRIVGRDDNAASIMVRIGCFSCHGQYAVDVHTGPPLDRETLVPRILDRLKSGVYRRTVSEVDQLTIEPYSSYRAARKEVLDADGSEKVRRWIRYHVMEPRFDRKESAMPNLGINEAQACLIADYLVDRNVSDMSFLGGSNGFAAGTGLRVGAFIISWPQFHSAGDLPLPVSIT